MVLDGDTKQPSLPPQPTYKSTNLSRSQSGSAMTLVALPRFLIVKKVTNGTIIITVHDACFEE